MAPKSKNTAPAPTQLPTVSYRLAPRTTGDAHARAKLAVLAAADVLGPTGVATFEAPSDPPEISGELLQTLRLLALPEEDAARLLDGCSCKDASHHDGFGYPPILSASGVDVWASLSDPTSPGGRGKPQSPADAWRTRGLSRPSREGDGKIAGGSVRIERAAYAKLLRDCRSLARTLRAGEEQATAAASADDGVSALVGAASAAAALARQAEAEAIELLRSTAREEARKLPKQLPSHSQHQGRARRRRGRA